MNPMTDEEWRAFLLYGTHTARGLPRFTRTGGRINQATSGWLCRVLDNAIIDPMHVKISGNGSLWSVVAVLSAWLGLTCIIAFSAQLNASEIA